MWYDSAKMNFRAQTKTTMKSARQLEVLVSPKIIKAVESSAKIVAEEARILVPVDTGALRASIKSSVEVKGTNVTGYVIAATHYAMYVEFGTGIAGASSPGSGPYAYNMSWPGMRAQPYLRPALVAGKGRIMAEFRNAR
jgi:HK97 gp10 family phage protein